MEYIFFIPAILMSIIIHEVSHGFAAYMLGDDTAKRQGRLNFNPLNHIDTFGTIILPLLLLITTRGGLAFGYAKPVPINPYNFKNYKKDTAITAAAGPLSNFIIAVVLSVLIRLTISILSPFVVDILVKIIVINILLGMFNLIPFPPLDGSKVLGAFLSDEMYFKYTAQEKKGMMIFMLILVASYMFNLNLIERIIFPPVFAVAKLLLSGI